uniref:Tudor domain-containing protein 1-like n=1 Tax=Saccoglossus kowalevskii TaxID=10224 RepID=A0ABM0MVM3_SACKO
VHKAKKSNGKLIMNATEMIKQLSSARELPCYVVATEENSDERDFDVKFDQLVSTLMTHGRIECRTTPRYELKSSSELPGDWLPPPLLLQQLEDNEDIRSLADSEKAETESIRSDSTTLSSKSRSTTKTSPISKIAKKLVRNSQCSPPRCELVKVTHIKTPCHFMIQRCSDADRYENIRRVINKYCNESRCEAVDDVEVGDIYCCKYAFDKVWYRCRIKSLITIDSDDDDDDDIIEYEQAEIIYIDYGNTEIVPISRLKKLKSKFMLVPELAVRCSLVDIVPTDQTEKWPVGAIHAFASMVGKKPVLMTVLDHSGGVLYIDLQKPPSDDIDNDTPVSVRDALVFLELAQFETPASRPLPGVPMVTPPRKFVLPCLPKKGDYVDIVVSHITNPSDLCIQKLGGELPYLSSLMREMRDTFKTERGDVWQIYCPQLNMICAAKYGLDDNWYRAQVIDIIDDIPSVVLYDTTGKADVCINALLVSEGIAKSTGPNSASDKAVIQPVEEKEKAPSMPVGPIATAEKHPAKYKPKCKPANNVAYTEVLVSHIESPACIFAQLATAEEDGLSMLMKSITSYYNALEEIEEKEWEEGDMCAALFVHGEVWCRSRIISLLPGNLCVVLYIDYGNSEVITLDSLRVLKPEFMIPPPYAICCHLSGIQPAGGKNWTRTACEFLVTLICGVQCFLIQKAEYGDEGVATTVPIDLLYESPTTIVTSDTDKAPEPVLESAVQTMILQGLALPCRPQTKSISPVKEQEITLKISPMIEPDEGSEELSQW